MDTLQTPRERGAALMREKRFREAADALADAVAQSPEDATSWRLLGGALVALGDTRGAVAAFERALALAPELPKNHYNLALALQANGDSAGARQHFEYALSRDPGYEQARQRLAELNAAPPPAAPPLPEPVSVAAAPPLYKPPPGGYIPPAGLGYGQQQAQRERPPQQAPYSLTTPQVNGNAVLAWGILGLVVLWIFSPLAWIMGNRSLEILNRYPEADQSQRSSVVVGRTLGIVGTVLLLISFAIFFLLMLVSR